MQKRETWESFWSSTDGDSAVWDVDPTLAAERHWPIMQQHMDTSLPLVDVCCGSGTQTWWFHERYDGRVVGTDISRAALERARRHGDAVSFAHVDVTDPAPIAAVASVLGDCNVYVRSILHMFEQPDRERIAGNIAQLLGERGHVFNEEMEAKQHGWLHEQSKQAAAFRAPFSHGIELPMLPDGFARQAWEAAGLTIVADEHNDGMGIYGTWDTGEQLEARPARFVLARR